MRALRDIDERGTISWEETKRELDHSNKRYLPGGTYTQRD